MSTNSLPIAEITEVAEESLAERMARSPLPLREALRHATEIATILRDMHAQGLAYGAVSTQLVVLGATGATLRQTGRLTRLGDGHTDVTAFGAVLAEMVRREGGLDVLLQDLRSELQALATQCQEESPDMKQVLIALRLLGLQARVAMAPARRTVAAPAAPAAEKTSVTELLRSAFEWRPLANLAAFALSSK